MGNSRVRVSSQVRTVLLHTALKYDVEAAGGEWEDRVVTDDNLVTAQAWPDHPEWISQFLDVLGTEISHGEPVAADD